MFVLVDHFYNFQRNTTSLIGAGFDFATYFASAVLWVTFLKFIWFERGKLEEIINVTSTSTTNLEGYRYKLFQFVSVTMSIWYAYFNFEVVILTIKRYEEMTHKLPPYVKMAKIFTTWLSSGSWVTMAIQTHILLFYYVIHGLIFALSCSMIAKGWEFEKQLTSIGSKNIEKVNAFKK